MKQQPTLAEIAAGPAVLSLEAVAQIFGIGKSNAYELVKRGEFPCRVITVGRRYVVASAALVQVLNGGDHAGAA